MMNRLAVVVLAAAFPILAFGSSAVAGRSHSPAIHPRATATYRNPVFPLDFPDPAVLKDGRDYYAYATTAVWEAPGRLFPVLHSRDLVHWRYVGDAMTKIPAWANDDFWAPDVISRHGTYFLYYVGKYTDSNLHCVAVATAQRPTGPFVHRNVIGCRDATGRGYIDPAPLLTPDGKAYLYVSVDDPYHSISVIPLASDLLHAAGPRKELFTVTQPWESGPYFSTVEGPFPVKHGSTYYVFYSGNSYGHEYAMGYATAPSPLGPFTKYARNPILRGTARVAGPGGGSVVQGPHGDWWLVYHVRRTDPEGAMVGARDLFVDRLIWHGAEVSVHGPTITPQPMP